MIRQSLLTFILVGLDGVGRTYELCDEKVQRSIPENDLHALEEIRKWLGYSLQKFQFEA